jgi:hypothetical protein
MRFAIEILLDSETAGSLVKIWEDLRAKQLAAPQTLKRPYVTHISLAVTDDIDVDKYSTITKKIAGRHSCFELLFTHWGIFRSDKEVLFIAPRPCAELTALHLDVFTSLEGCGVVTWHLYRPKRWVPHCAITVRDSYDDICSALRLVEQLKLPFTAHASKLALVDFINGEELWVCDLERSDRKLVTPKPSLPTPSAVTLHAGREARP